MIMSKGSDLGSPNAHLLKSPSIVVEDFCTPQTDEVKSNRMFMNIVYHILKSNKLDFHGSRKVDHSPLLYRTNI